MELLTMLTTIIVALITAVFGPIAMAWAKRQFETKSTTNPVDEAILMNALVDEQLDVVLDELGCDRVWVAQFHNGGHFYPTGKSIQKFSIFYEVTKVGVSSVSHTFNNIPCSLYPKTFEHTMDGNNIFIPDFQDPKVATYGLKGAAESVGTKSTYLVPLFTLDDKYIGNIGMDYVGRKKKMTKDDWEHFQIKAGRIAGYISNHLKTA